MVKIIAHRGCSGIHIDNSYEAILCALDTNVDMIEFDIRLTKSNELAIYHDWRIDKDLIHQNTMEELKEKYQIISLDDVLQLYHLYASDRHKATLLLDIKTPHYSSDTKELMSQLIVKKLQKYIKNKMITYNDFICSSFNSEILDYIHNYDDMIQLGYITDYIHPEVLKTLPNNYKFISLYYNEISEGLLDKLHNMGLQVFLFTVNNSYDMRNFLDMNIDGIITNYPDKLLKVIREKTIQELENIS